MSIKLDVENVMVQEVNLELKRLDVGLVMVEVQLFLKLVLKLFMSYVMIVKELVKKLKLNVLIVLERVLFQVKIKWI